VRTLCSPRRIVSRADVGPGRTALVLLSGRVETVRGDDGRLRRVLSPSCAERVVEAARVYELIAPEWVISTGGLKNPALKVRTAAEMMRDELVAMGVPAGAILVESASRNTYEEAVNVASILRSIGASQIVLVTSESHMRRAAGAFRAQGLSPIPAPAPDPDLVRMWAHEFIGILYYRLRGWYSGPRRQSATAH
jgi:uncharacterized SAM-binding protein YcdF (DUF218 family)